MCRLQVLKYAGIFKNHLKDQKETLALAVDKPHHFLKFVMSCSCIPLCLNDTCERWILTLNDKHGKWQRQKELATVIELMGMKNKVRIVHNRFFLIYQNLHQILFPMQI